MTVRKIPVTVVSGGLGSGKTTFLNRLLATSPGDVSDTHVASSIIVLVNELGDIELEHTLARRVNDNVVLLDSGCTCCAVRGQLVDTLRDLFLSALRKKIPIFSRIVIETMGNADPAAIGYTLKYERFLSDRYMYDGCITVVDAVLGIRHLEHGPMAARQAAHADVLVVSKADLVSSEDLAALQKALRVMNPDAEQYLAQEAPVLQQLLHEASPRAGVSEKGHRPASWFGRRSAFSR